MKENAALHAKILTTSQRERATLKGENERLDFEWMARVISSHNLEKRKLPAKQRLTFPRGMPLPFSSGRESSKVKRLLVCQRQGRRGAALQSPAHSGGPKAQGQASPRQSEERASPWLRARQASSRHSTHAPPIPRVFTAAHLANPSYYPHHSSLVIRRWPHRLFPGHLPLRSRERTGTIDCLGNLACSTLKLPS